MPSLPHPTETLEEMLARITQSEVDEAHTEVDEAHTQPIDEDHLNAIGEVSHGSPANTGEVRPRTPESADLTETGHAIKRQRGLTAASGAKLMELCAADCPNRPKGKLSLAARMEPGAGKESEMVVHLEQTRTYQIIVTTKGDAKPVVKIVPVDGPTHENTHAPEDTYPADETMNPEDLRGVEIDSDWLQKIEEHRKNGTLSPDDEDWADAEGNAVDELMILNAVEEAGEKAKEEIEKLRANGSAKEVDRLLALGQAVR
ncbi:MAG: hypothetical protein TREMPRED_005611, partial [Tremellales sp. Tagirdzhanova-0007]